MLGLGGVLPMKKMPGATVIDLSPIPWITLPSFDAWVLRFEYLDTENVEHLVFFLLYENLFRGIRLKHCNGMEF